MLTAGAVRPLALMTGWPRDLDAASALDPSVFQRLILSCAAAHECSSRQKAGVCRVHNTFHFSSQSRIVPKTLCATFACMQSFRCSSSILLPGRLRLRLRLYHGLYRLRNVTSKR